MVCANLITYLYDIFTNFQRLVVCFFCIQYNIMWACLDLSVYRMCMLLLRLIKYLLVPYVYLVCNGLPQLVATIQSRGITSGVKSTTRAAVSSKIFPMAQLILIRMFYYTVFFLIYFNTTLLNASYLS